MKFDYLIEYNKINIFLQKSCRKWDRKTISKSPFIFKKTFYDVIGSGLQLSFNIFRQPSTWHTRKTNCIKLQTTDPDKGPIFIFQESFWKQFLHNILQMIFQEKCFSCHVLLTDQISLLNCPYFLRYWVICVLQLFVYQVVASEILKLTLSF